MRSRCAGRPVASGAFICMEHAQDWQVFLHGWRHGFEATLALAVPGQSLGCRKWLENARRCGGHLISNLHAAVLRSFQTLRTLISGQQLLVEHRLDAREVVPWGGGAGQMIAAPPGTPPRRRRRGAIERGETDFAPRETTFAPGLGEKR